jgi:hypothetical protein
MSNRQRASMINHWPRIMTTPFVKHSRAEYQPGKKNGGGNSLPSIG